MAIPTHKEWIEGTAVTGRFRSNELKAIDTALDEYLKQQNPQKLNILKSTLTHWEMSTTYLSTQPDGSFILEDWKKSKRNSKKTVERLHQHLFGTATNIDSSKEMLEAIKMVSDYNAKNFQTIFAGKKMEIKKSAVKEVYDSIKNDLKATRKELKGLPDVNINMPNLPNIKQILIDWFKKIPGINIHLLKITGWINMPNFNLPDFFKNLKMLNLPTIVLPDLAKFLKIKFPDINLDFMSGLGISIPGLPSMPSIPSFNLPSMPDIDFALKDIFGDIDFQIAMDFIPDLIADIKLELLGLFSDAIPFMGAGKSATKAFSGYGKAIYQRYKSYAASRDNANNFAPNGAEDAFRAVIALMEREANRTAAVATVDLSAAAIQTGGVFLDAGVLSGPITKAANIFSKLVIKIGLLISDYKEVKEANKILARGGELNPFDLFTACPLLGCFLIHCSNTSAIMNFAVDKYGAPGWTYDMDYMIKKAAPVTSKAYEFIQKSKFTIRKCQNFR